MSQSRRIGPRRAKPNAASKEAELRRAIDLGWDQCDRGRTQPLDAAGTLAEVRRHGTRDIDAHFSNGTDD